MNLFFSFVKRCLGSWACTFMAVKWQWIRKPVCSYHTSFLSFSLILTRVSVTFPGLSTADLFYFSVCWKGDSSATHKPLCSIRMCSETSPGILCSFSILKGLVRLQDDMHQVITFPFSAPPAWKKVYAATTVCFSLHCFSYLFVLCFCHSDLICATDGIVSPTFLLPAGKELMLGTDGCWGVCKAKHFGFI